MVFIKSFSKFLQISLVDLVFNIDFLTFNII